MFLHCLFLGSLIFVYVIDLQLSPYKVCILLLAVLDPPWPLCHYPAYQSRIVASTDVILVGLAKRSSKEAPIEGYFPQKVIVVKLLH